MAIDRERARLGYPDPNREDEGVVVAIPEATCVFGPSSCCSTGCAVPACTQASAELDLRPLTRLTGLNMWVNPNTLYTKS